MHAPPPAERPLPPDISAHSDARVIAHACPSPAPPFAAALSLRRAPKKLHECVDSTTRRMLPGTPRPTFTATLPFWECVRDCGRVCAPASDSWAGVMIRYVHSMMCYEQKDDS